MNHTELTEWLLGEAETIIVAETSVTSSAAPRHVGIADSGTDQQYPYVGIQTVTTDPITAGIGAGAMTVAATTTDNTGTLTEVVYERTARVRYELVPVVDNDPADRDRLGEAIGDYFGLLGRTDGFPTDVTPIEIGEYTQRGRAEDFVRGVGVPLELEYDHEIVDSDPDVASDVALRVEADEPSDGADPDDDTGATVIDRTVE